MPAVDCRKQQDILQLFADAKRAEHGFLAVSAPMVRYSKLEFRRLLRRHGVKLSFTPMIIADSFIRSEKARANEFTTAADDVPLIAQFAAKNAQEFVNAAQLISPYVDGVDLNCGCPQTWAKAEGYGCALLQQPELISDIVRRVRGVLPTTFSISAKLRLLDCTASMRATVDFVQQLEHCGITFLSVHGRTSWQRNSEPVNVAALALIKQSMRQPLIVNGNVQSWQEACDLHAATHADGVMAARGLLSNPTLFENTPVTSLDCVRDWLSIAHASGDALPFKYLHHHLVFMWSSQMHRKLRHEFNNFSTKQQIFDYFRVHHDLTPADSYDWPVENTACTYGLHGAQQPDDDYGSEYNHNSNGKFFTEFNAVEPEEEQQDDLGLADIFG